VIVEFEGISDVVTDATTEDDDNVIVELELVGNTDADASPEDEDELRLELEAVSDEEDEPEAVAKTAFARRLPSVELLELYIEFTLEELEIGRLDNEEEPE
jgi:hypothetical protein